MQKEIMEKEIAEIIKGFRQDSIEIEINQGHVHKWISQFSPATQDIILEETLHILKEWYFGKDKINLFLDEIMDYLKSENENATDEEPMKDIYFWDIQKSGKSQSQLVEMLKSCNWKGNLDLLNIVLIGITNEIPEHDEKYEMHRLIGALLSSELKEQEKLDIIEHEYNIPISQEFREDVRIMCNLSTGIEEKATEKTSEKFILNMYKKGYTLDQIADVAETGVDEVKAIIKKKEPAMA